MKISIVLSLLVLGCLAMDFDQQIEELQSSNFGQTIFQTIMMELKTEDPVVSNLINMVQGIETTLENEQQRDDDRIVRIRQNCDIDITTLKNQINQNTIASLGLKSQLDSLNPQKVQAVANLERKNNEITDLKAELQYQSHKRETETQAYETILDNLEQALFGVNQVKGYFNSYLDILVKNRKRFEKPSFLEESYSFKYEESEQFDSDSRALTSLTQVAQKVNKIKHHVQLEGYATMLEIMSELASKAADEPSQAEVLTRKVLSILKQIENYIQSERIREDQAEALRSSNFDLLKTLLSDQLVQANQDKTYMEGLVASLSTRITQGANEKFEVDQKVAIKTKELENRQTDCRLKNNEYETDTQNRIKQKRVVFVAVDLISSKLGQLKRKLLED
ncbi:unnamed protein product [Paramecium sonneborni]|uniref:Uncharacterized protein n=1 Tax=Paramecium sonneborni TaxID=65129 RepID=A0A8S1MC49_9CILI|nr:unnamed protein product [Paramecium sonneborni]